MFAQTLAGRSPEVFQENVRMLMASGMDEQTALQVAMQRSRGDAGDAGLAPEQRDALLRQIGV
jgi:hypothetical protein